MLTTQQSPDHQVNTEMPELSTIRDVVALAARQIAPVWPLRSFVAVNPLQGLEELPFEQAVLDALNQRAVHSPGVAGLDDVNRELIKWCSACLDEGQAAIALPLRDQGLYASFIELARYDQRLIRSQTSRLSLESLPAAPLETIAQCLSILQIDTSQHEEFLRQALTALPGWSGYVKWKEYWQDPEDFAKRPATLIDYLAVRLILTCLLWPEARVLDGGVVELPVEFAQLSSRETQFRDALLERLPAGDDSADTRELPAADAQLIFCIDVRSEPFRRAVEAQGHYETLGFAGFFGVPVQWQGLGQLHPQDCCPVLLKPRHLVSEQPAAFSSPVSQQRFELGRRLMRLPGTCYQWLKYHFATPFALVEMLGPWLGLQLLMRALSPSLWTTLTGTAGRAVAPSITTVPALDDIELHERADYGESMLRLLSLTDRLAPLVVLCGHGSSTTNNPYAASLDCGACGGNHGGGNARVLAEILNCRQVRAILSSRGLDIPQDTVFVAAQHDTTTDEVELYRPQSLTASQNQRLSVLQSHLKRAQVSSAAGRVSRMGLSAGENVAVVQEIRRRSMDWSEVRPEWGLARNAAMIVGPRALTQHLDLEGRCFLHSYDWATDQAGQHLTTILTAPMVVAQWINSQYLFSTLDNTLYGSGSKVTHNVTGKLGVMQGNASDLMHGLPLQSVFAADGQPYHEPQRLLTVVYAPRTLLQNIIQAQEVLQKLFRNGWVNLVCIDPCSSRIALLRRDLQWEVLRNAEAATAGDGSLRSGD